MWNNLHRQVVCPGRKRPSRADRDGLRLTWPAGQISRRGLRCQVRKPAAAAEQNAREKTGEAICQAIWTATNQAPGVAIWRVHWKASGKASGQAPASALSQANWAAPHRTTRVTIQVAPWKSSGRTTKQTTTKTRWKASWKTSGQTTSPTTTTLELSAVNSAPTCG